MTQHELPFEGLRIECVHCENDAYDLAAAAAAGWHDVTPFDTASYSHVGVCPACVPIEEWPHCAARGLLELTAGGWRVRPAPLRAALSAAERAAWERRPQVVPEDRHGLPPAAVEGFFCLLSCEHAKKPTR